MSYVTNRAYILWYALEETTRRPRSYVKFVRRGRSKGIAKQCGAAKVKWEIFQGVYFCEIYVKRKLEISTVFPIEMLCSQLRNR